tara:strand:- start:5574 stop:6149 length:576 start_codon:yes stop_codon:yes gene_type:complete
MIRPAISKNKEDSPDLFNVSIPGEGLTEKLGDRPYEQPPEYDSPVDALNFVLKQYYQPVTFKNIVSNISVGTPLETIVDVLTFSGFAGGKYTVDVAELMKPALLLNLIADARDLNIEPIILSKDTSPQEMNPDDFVAAMQAQRPEKHSEILNNMHKEPEIMQIEGIPKEEEAEEQLLSEEGFINREMTDGI